MWFRQLVRHRDSVIASGTEERIRKEKEKERWIRGQCGSHRGTAALKSHIKSFGVIA